MHVHICDICGIFYAAFSLTLHKNHKIKNHYTVLFCAYVYMFNVQ